ncbi:MAG: thioredoxin family protein [Saprospiraceae bacterium]|nr:thioredoxin family protein [Saprospiraceae bacterium]
MSTYAILIIFDNTSIGNQVFSAANQVWADVEHPNAINGPLFLNVDEQENPGLTSQLQITQVPTVFFVEILPNDQGKIISRLEGNSSYEQIRGMYEAVLNGQFSEENGGSGGSTETFPLILPGSVTDSVSPGLLGLFNFNLNLPPFLLLIGAVVTSYKTVTAKKTTGQVLWGTGAALLWTKYLKK